MEEGKNEIMELRQMIEGCFERQNKLIARLEMELEALSNFNGKQMLDSRDMRLQLKVCDRTLIRWRMSGSCRPLRSAARCTSGHSTCTSSSGRNMARPSCRKPSKNRNQ